MNYHELMVLAEERIREARLLLDNELYFGAYYLSGYSIECALKAFIARNIQEGTFPDKKLANEAHTHDLSKLLRLSGLEPRFNEDTKSEPHLRIVWNVVRDWNEGSRYKGWSDIEAKDMVDSVSSPNGGVLEWIRQYW